MKKIAVTGGKGGTGKSVFSLFLAKKLSEEGKKVILCDCDVECPNDYLIIGEKLRRPIGKTTAKFPKLIKSKCKKCGICVKACRSNAIFQAPGQYPVFIKDLCSGCGACWQSCPFGAIVPKEETTGRIYQNKVSKNFCLITGEANPGLEETGPIVRQAKEKANLVAKKTKADYIIFDTAAGTHCPVINAIIGADYAYAVTEPTPMGVYDLEMILSLLKKLRVKGEIVINKADLVKNNKVLRIAKKYKFKVGAKINYSKELAENYSKGQLLKQKIKILWQ